MARFKNVFDSPPVPGVKQLLKWTVVDSVSGRRRRAPRRAPVPVVANDGRRLREAVGLEAATWVGHATFLIQTGGLAILTDPIFSTRIATIRRNVPPGLRIEDLPAIDVILISHNHRDHLDLPTLRRLGPRPLALVPSGVGRTMRRAGLERVIELEWWQSHDVADVRFTFVPSHHWSGRSIADRNASLWGGWGILSPRRRLYFAGDTGYFPGFREIGERLGPLDAALLPVGSYDPRWFMRAQHMDPSDAVRAFVDLGADRLIAMHWGTFKLTDEPLDEPPRLLDEERRRANLDPRHIVVPAIGQTIELGAPAG
ncbi:MAG: MBL fold metallo-hydrolase [Deltaproteobacteria bacterium]|nr:MBL fold metallo-hydrolase [Deltaproteobacteria bacterium]